jgi:hypothetical protein
MTVQPKLFRLEVHIRTIPQRAHLRGLLTSLLDKSDLRLCSRTWHEQPTTTYNAKWWSDTVTEISANGDPEAWLLFFEDDVDQLNPHILHNIENWSALDEPDFGLGWMIVPNGVLGDKGKLGTSPTGAIYRKWPALHNSALVLVQRKVMKRLTDDVVNNENVYDTCDYAGNWKHPDSYAGFVLASTDIGWTWGMTNIGFKTYIHAPGLATTDEITGFSFVQQRVAADWGRRCHEKYDGSWRAPVTPHTKSFAEAVAAACRSIETPAAPLDAAVRLLAQRPATRRSNILEFGVYSGQTITATAETLRAAACLGNFRIVGFDSFNGLPETWRPQFPAGMFSTNGATPPVPSEVELVIGLFQDTLPNWMKSNGGPVTLVHVDCDLYSSTVCVFDNIFARTDADTLWVFDELYNYDGFQCGEMAALAELCAKYDLVPEIIAAGGQWGQAAAMFLRRR